MLFGNVISMSKTTSNAVKNLSNSVGNIGFRDASAYHLLLGGSGESHLFRKQKEKINEEIKRQALKNCHLMVGTIEPRKAHIDVLKAFKKAWKKGSTEKLLIVGKIGWKIEKTLNLIEKSKELNKKLFFLEFVSDADLEYLYKNSKSLIIASKGEGLGLPIVEANSHNLPIICRDIDVFRELAQNNAYYFKDVDGLEEIISNESIQEKDLDLSKITWKNSADEIERIIFNEKKPDFIVKSSNKLIKSGDYLDEVANGKNSIKVKKPEIASYSLSGNYFHLIEGDFNVSVKLKVNSRSKIHFKVLSNLGQNLILSEIVNISEKTNYFKRNFKICSNFEPNVEIMIYNLDQRNDYEILGIEIEKK